MPQITQHKILVLYEQYKSNDITFNKQVIEYTQLIPDEIYLKHRSTNYPCILNSSSMVGARVIAQVNQIFFEELNKTNKSISLRFAFKRGEKHNPLTFFIKSKVTGFNLFGKNKPNLYFINLNYTQKPPDDLIEILGSLIEIKTNAKSRKNDRIIITADSIKRLKIKQAKASLICDRKEHTCLLRDVSFLGAKIIISGKGEDFLKKQIILVIRLEDQSSLCALPGIVIRNEEIKGRDDFVVLGLYFKEEKVPLSYKMTLNEYLSKKSILTKDIAKDEPSKEESPKD